MLWELGIKNAIYNPVNYDLDRELFTARMRDTVLQMAPLSLFGPFVAIFVPHLGQPINVVIRTVADFREAQTMWQGKECKLPLRGRA